MDQTAALADALIKTPSLLGNLLSQMSGDLSDSFSQGDMFSNLLSQNGSLAGDGAASLGQIAATPAAGLYPDNAASASPDSLLQNLGDLSNGLQKVLNLLRQQNNAASNGQNQNNAANGSSAVTGNSAANSPANTGQNQAAAQSTAQTGTTQTDAASSDTSSNGNAPAGSAAAQGDSPAASAADTAAPDSTPPLVDDARKLADIVAQLLLLIQMIAENLRRTQNAATTAASQDATQNAAAAATTAAAPNDAANAAALAANAATLVGDALKSLATFADAINGASPGASGSGAASPSDPFQQLLMALQKTVQQLMPAVPAAADADADGDSGTASAADASVGAAILPLAGTDTTSLAADLWSGAGTGTAPQNKNAAATQLATLEMGLKNIIANLQKQAAANAATAQTAASNAASTPSAASSDTTGAQTPTPSLATTDASTRNAAADSWQSQLFGLAGASAPSTATPTSGQVFAANAAAIMAGEKNTGGTAFDSGSDGLTGQDGAPSSGGAPAGTVTAEGAQAAGTYNFASQLSAFRAVNGGTVGLPTVVDQVILQMNRSVKSGNDQMSLQLQPADLGKITVKLDFGGDGKVQGTVTADNPKTLDMLQKDSRSLERALQDAGLRADPGSLQFNLGGQPNGNNAGQAAAGSANAATVAEDTAVAPGDDLVTDLGALAETYYITPTGVNIRV